MKNLAPVPFRSHALLAIAALTVAMLFSPTPSRAQNVDEVARSGPYSFNLKVLPPETFDGAHAEMMHDGGAAGMAMNGSAHPNHHLVVFIKKDGRPVEDARVTITYRESGSKHWKELPVARMHVTGKGPETTHYGNNVQLPPGKYEVRVALAGATPAMFNITLDK